MTEKDNVMTANRTVREWKARHKSDYDDFKRQVANIGKGDLSLMEQMMVLLNDCMPQDARDFYAYIFKYVENPDSVKNDQRAFSRYDQLAADCIFNGTIIKLDVAAGKIGGANMPGNNCTIIKTDDFTDKILSMPQNMRCMINDTISHLMASSIDMPMTEQDRMALQNIGMLVAKTVYVYSLLFVPEYLERLYQRIVVDREPLAYCIYYFVTFDHGLRQMADAFSRQMAGEGCSSFSVGMLSYCIRRFVQHSLSNRTDTKEGWLELANQTHSDDCWKEIMLALRDSQTHGGQQKDSRTINELLIGDTERLETLIKDYLSENPGASRLAYLLYALRQTDHIECCNYITFHRALQAMVGRPLGGPDVPQKRYHELMADPKLLNSKGKKWQQANIIVERWKKVFLTQICV